MDALNRNDSQCFDKHEKCEPLQNISRRTDLSAGILSFVLLAWHLYVEFNWSLVTLNTSNLFTLTWLLTTSDICPSTIRSFTNQETVGVGLPELWQHITTVNKVFHVSGLRLKLKRKTDTSQAFKYYFIFYTRHHSLIFEIRWGFCCWKSIMYRPVSRLQLVTGRFFRWLLINIIFKFRVRFACFTHPSTASLRISEECEKRFYWI